MSVAEIDQLVGGLLDAQPLGQRGGQQQPGAGYRTGVADAVGVSGGQDLPDGDVARVDQVDVGQQVTGREVGLAALDGVQVGDGGRRWWPRT